jgi:hypothetical protein
MYGPLGRYLFVSSGQISVSRPEKHIFLCSVSWVRQPVSCSVGSARNCAISGRPSNYVVNATVLAAISFLAAAHVCAKLLPLLHPLLRARTDARTNPNAQTATQLRSVLAHLYAVSKQNQTTANVQ